VDYFYRPEFIDIFLQPQIGSSLRGAVTSVLAGTTSKRIGIRARLALFFLVVRLQRYFKMRDPLPRLPVLAPPPARDTA
jgi:hypothetical protein